MGTKLGLLKKTTVAALGGLAIVIVSASVYSDAEARGRHRGNGGAVAAGIVGGLAAGALLGAAASRPAYAEPYGYYPGKPVYVAEPVYEEVPVTCRWRKRKVWIDDYTYQVQRVQICD
jgi:hypothetical protein